MASVTPDRVRNRVNLSTSDIGDSIVTEFIVDASAEVMAETGLTIDYNNCTEAEAACITDLAALYCLTYLTGGSTTGTDSQNSFSTILSIVRDLQKSVVSIAQFLKVILVKGKLVSR